jgi:hypothetical protein
MENATGTLPTVQKDIAEHKLQVVMTEEMNYHVMVLRGRQQKENLEEVARNGK